MVARGDLPPVAERLPAEPRRISPDDEFTTYETGRYSDRWVDVVAGSVEETQGLTGEARAGREDDLGNISPWSFRGWEANADNTVWTFYMREGLKWSDGVPYDTEDMQFFLEDIQQRAEYFAATGWSRLNGIVDGMQIEYLDDYTFRITSTRRMRTPTSWPPRCPPPAWRAGSICWETARTTTAGCADPKRRRSCGPT